MKFLQKFCLVTLLGMASSCAMMFNEKTVDVSISSTPPGADIFINGKNYGHTPAKINIEPKNYTVVLNKEGYGSTKLQLESWTSLRNGKCLADALGAMLILPYYSVYYSGKCDDFKQPEYHAVIPQLNVNRGNNNSIIGAGQSPANMIDYYYNQDMVNRPQNNKNVTKSGQEYYGNQQ